MDAANSVWNPEAQLSDIEPFEPIWPLKWLGRGVQTDGGGYGKHRGGATIASLYVIEPPAKFVESGAFMSGDKVFLSAGTMGGYPAPARYRYTMRDTNFAEVAEKQLPLPHEEGDPADPDFARLLEGELVRTPGQSASVEFKRYDLIYQTSGGGGGWGDPLERPPELVVQELNDGRVFAASAEKVYGVVVTKASDKDLYVLDSDKTALRREQIKKERLARAVPTKDFLAKEREKVVEGKFAPIVKEMYNDSFENSPRFLQEYREFWDLPEDFAGF
jgi:acetone carboxylase alpha subunit